MTRFSQRDRIKSTRHFKQVYKTAKRLDTQWVRVYIAPKCQETGKYGFVAGKKAGPAVQRNKSKRRLREIVRGHLSHLSPDYDIVFVAKPPMASGHFSQIEKNMASLLRQYMSGK